MLSLDTREARLEALKRVGHTYQIAGTRHYSLTEGSCRKTRVIDVKTGSGLEYSVVPDRGLDISLASYKGINLTYLTRNLEVYPAFFENDQNNWFRTFFAGLLTTCGSAYLGPPCVDKGEFLGLHGRFNVTPARNVNDISSYTEGKISIRGDIEDCTTFGDKVVVSRHISSRLGESVIAVEDTVTNIGSKDCPLTLLYHINFGYPLLSEQADILVQSRDCFAYDEYSQQHMDEIRSFANPSGKNLEKNYWHVFDGNKTTAFAMIANRELCEGIAVYIQFNPQTLPYLSQWKLEDETDYVLALEPSNTLCLSRDELREKNLLPNIKAKDTFKLAFEIGVIEGNKSIDGFLKQISGE